MSEISIRSYTLERDASSDDGRTLSIRAVPWDTETELGPGVWESFDAHAFDAQLRAAFRLKLTLGHPRAGDRLTDSLIGNLTQLESRDDGLHVQARVASSVTAGEALALINDGVLDQVSIGFMDLATNRLKREDGGVMLRRTRAHLVHVALVGEGAYGDSAKVLTVREVASRPRLEDLRVLMERLAADSC
jgi:HK97 family phage prohead protease